MKSLAEILEGIFDIDNNINDTTLPDKMMIDDKESDFWKFLNHVNMTRWFMDNGVDVDRNKKVISCPDACFSIKTSKNPLSNKYTLNCKEFYVGERSGMGPHPGKLVDGAGFKDIHCNKLFIDGMSEEIEGFNFYLSDKLSRCTIYNSFALNAKNTTIDFDEHGVIRFESVTDLPNIKGLKSNAPVLFFYDPSLFDYSGNKKTFDDFFGVGEIECGGVVKKKNIRNIIAMSNNPTKYGSIDPDDIKPVKKLSDLIDLSGFKNVERITFANNNVEITFVKIGNRKAIERQARYIRMNDMKKYKEYQFGALIKKVEDCSTPDGWIMLISKRIF